MTQFFNSSSSTLASEKQQRTFGVPVSTNKLVAGPGQRIKNFFRINSSSNESKREEKDSRNSDTSSNPTPKADGKSSIRQSRFIPYLGRNRSQTVASEGNPLDEHISPTAHANPYFQHQGPPTLRHHNDTSVPPSPPDTPTLPYGNGGATSGSQDQQKLANREELARKLRRVASAPNAQGLFASDKFKAKLPTGESLAIGKIGLTQLSNASAVSVLETVPSNSLAPAVLNGIPSPGQIRNQVAFRRTYSSNSIKVRSVEVGPGSFDKIKLIGKGDVGKVYLVREKKSSRLYAMKGSILMLALSGCSTLILTISRSVEQVRNDQAK